MEKLTMWALFDCATGSWSKYIDKEKFNVINIGIDDNASNYDDFVEVNLAELSFYSDFIAKLKGLPHPDIIVASPPCETWSLASNMEKVGSKYAKGNNYLYYFNEPTSFFQTNLSFFQIRKKPQEKHPIQRNNIRHNELRIKGELTAINTINIIKEFNPKIWMIENPKISLIFDYFENVLEFQGKRNNLYYSHFDENYSLKPTCFYSNFKFCVDKKYRKSKVKRYGLPHDKLTEKNYNEISEIPEKVVKYYSEIMYKILNK